MVMPSKSFPVLVHDFGFLMSEGPGRISREQGVVAAAALATDAPPGLVIGRLTANSKLVRFNPTGNDGSQNIVGILGMRQAASATDKVAAYVARLAEVRGLDLTWPNGITQNQLTAAIAQLAALMIIVRV